MGILKSLTQFYLTTTRNLQENIRPFTWKKFIFTPEFPFKVFLWKPTCHYLFHYSSGYEHYKTMRADPSLCFLSKVGLPSNMNDSIAGEATDPDDRWGYFQVWKISCSCFNATLFYSAYQKSVNGRIVVEYLFVGENQLRVGWKAINPTNNSLISHSVSNVTKWYIITSLKWCWNMLDYWNTGGQFLNWSRMLFGSWSGLFCLVI